MSSITLTYAGTTLTNMPGVTAYAEAIDSAPPRVQKWQSVPNRNGGVLIDDGYYANIQQSYNLVIRSTEVSAAVILQVIRNFLMSKTGFNRLEDSANREEYYEAYLPSGVYVEPAPERDVFTMHLAFERKPQRFLRNEGDVEIVGAGTATVMNPWMPCSPVIRAYKPSGATSATGTVTIGDITFQVDVGDTEYVELDCATGITRNAAGEAVSSSVLFLKLPVIETGNVTVGYTGDFERVVIVPRFWRL